MPRKKTEPFCVHGPDNAEHEIRKAYHLVIETCAIFFSATRPINLINLTEMIELYIRSYQCYRNANRLAAERWARAAKHLAQAFQHEVKIAYLEENLETLPFLAGAQDEEYGLFERSDTTADLLNSVVTHAPAGLENFPREMKDYFSRAHHHLKEQEGPIKSHELLRAERIQAAHEYGRTLECMALGYEAEFKSKSKAA